MGCIFAKVAKFHWTHWNYCMSCKHYHNIKTGKCGCGAINRVKREFEEPVNSCYYVDVEPGEKGHSISNTTWETVTSEEQVPIYRDSDNNTNYGSTSYTSYHTESVYGYVGNNYVQTGTRNVSTTRDIPSCSSSSNSRTIVGYETVSVSKKIPVITWRQVKVVTIPGTVKRIKDVSEEPKECKCLKQKCRGIFSNFFKR
jgi:hypothetical protein